MRTMLCTFAMLAAAATVQAEVPPGPDAVNGAFTRMIEHESGTTPAAGMTFREADERRFEHWVDRVARGETDSLEAGFVHMLARCDEVPRALPARGEREPLATMIAEALRAQQRAHLLLALQ